MAKKKSHKSHAHAKKGSHESHASHSKDAHAHKHAHQAEHKKHDDSKDHDGRHAHKGAAQHKAHKASVHNASVGNQNDSLKNAAIVVLALALVAVLVWGLSSNIGKDGSAPVDKGSASDNPISSAAGNFDIPAEIQAQMQELADNDPYLGAEDAPVVIVEFSDFECPFCTRFYTETLPAIKENFVDTGVVKFVYRDLPLSFHQNAAPAAEAAQCAHEQGKFWEYHDLLFENQRNLDANSLKKYAADVGLDVGQFTECFESGKYSAEVAADAVAAASVGISGTPGFIINGQKLSGAQPYDKFEQLICSLVPESEPCASIEPPTPVDVIILNDARCTACDTTGITATTTNYFPGSKYRVVDAQSAEGKSLIEEYDLVYAPTYLFDASVTETKAWKTQPQLQGFFVEAGDRYRLRDEAIQASWFLSEEQREAYFAQLNDMLGRESGDNRPQVDFFVMSYCPYGNQAEELLKPVFDELKDYADFNPRYVIYGQGTGCYTDDDGTQLCSLHGEVELNQNIRELCVLDDYGQEAWFDFALAMNSECNSNNADTCWTGVAEDLGYDTAAIESCFDENKVAYARKDFELNQALGVTGSPTLFFEAEQFNGARSSNAYLAALCAGFDGEKPDACDGVALPEPVAAPAQGSC